MHPRERRPTQYSRRDFLKRSAAGAFALTGASAFLAACGQASNPNATTPAPATSGGSSGGPSPTESAFPLARPDNPVTWPIYDDNPPIESNLEPESDATLRIYNWEDYLDPALANKFGKEMGCKVEITTFGGVDEALAKIRTGQVPYDVYFPDPSLLGKLVLSKLVQPLNKDYLPNLSNVWANIQSPFYDVGSQYTVPYVIYTTGVAWRNDHVPDDVAAMANPYELIWDTKYKGKIHVFDDYRESIALAFMKLGQTDVNTEDPTQLEAAKAELIKLIDSVNVRLDINDWTDLPEGASWIHQSWSGDMVSAQYYMPKGQSPDVLQYWYPPEGGGVVGQDNMVVLKSAENPVLAHMFINYLLDVDNAYTNFYNMTGYQPPMDAIDPDTLINDEVIPQNLVTTIVRPEDFDKGYWLLELSPAGDAAWHAAYQEFAAGAGG